jgi:hypothetical protein
VDIEINGFYKAPAVANLFDVFNDGGNHSHSTECVACGGQKMLNIVTGLPYGAADYEQDAYLLKEHQTPVCQVCWAETAA